MIRRLLCLLLLCGSALAQTFYISSSAGNDANAGTKVSPWAHLPGMVGYTNAHAPAAGETFILKGCDIWTNANFPDTWSWGTSSSSLINVGVDKTWYNTTNCPSAWNRPIFDAGSAVMGGTECSGGHHNSFLVTSTSGNPKGVNFDNIEMRGFYSNVDQQSGCFAAAGYIQLYSNWDYITFTNNYLHGETHGPSAKSGDNQLIALLSNGTPGCAHCNASYNTFDNTDADGGNPSTISGGGIWIAGDHNTVRGWVNAFKGATQADLGSNWIDTINLEAFDFPNGPHPNCFETTGAGLYGTSGLYTIHDNLITNSICEGLQVGNSGETDYVWNNVWVMTGASGSNGPQVPQGSSGGSLYYWNNTVYNWGCLQNAGHGTAYSGDFYAVNNLCINSGGTGITGTFTAAGTKLVTPNDPLTFAAATSQLFSSTAWFPFSPFSGASTIGCGVNETANWAASFTTSDWTGAVTEQTFNGVVQTVPKGRPIRTRPTGATAWDCGAQQFSLLLYPGGATTPTRQLNLFSVSENYLAQNYSHMLGAAGILNLNSAGTYLTGVTHSFPGGCTSASCTGQYSTYLDQVNPTGGIAGGACPSLNFTGATGIDTIMSAISNLGYINNILLEQSSYGATANNPNTYAPSYMWSQDWASNLDGDCAHLDSSLARQNAHAYLPGDYICFGSSSANCAGGNYWQMKKTSCSTSITGGTDLRCTTAGSPPGCLSAPTSPCTDGSGGNAAVWTLLGTAGSTTAPLMDGWVDSSFPGKNLYAVTVTSATAISGGSATFTVSNLPTYPVGTVMSPAAVVCGSCSPTTAYQTCSGSCTVTSSTATTVTINNLSGTASGGTVTGTISGAHFVNLNSPNSPSLALLATSLPVPWQQQARARYKYLFQQSHLHWGDNVGYMGLCMTKGCEADQSGDSSWPISATGMPGSNGSANMFISFEAEMYAFGAANGADADYAGRGNLNNSPTAEGPLMFAQSIGGDNNAIGANHAFTLDCYASNTPAAWCPNSITYGSGYPPAGKLYHGGDWALQFATTFSSAFGSGRKGVLTLQTTQEGTPGSSPGGCTTGTSAPPASVQCGVGVPGGCSGGVGQTTGSMVADNTCTNTTLSGGPFPGPAGYPGILPLAKQYLANNMEMYLCDALLALDPNYSTSTCNPKFSQGTYQVPYQNGFIAWLSTSAPVLPVFTSANAATFPLGIPTTFNVTATGTPLPALTLTGGSLPSGCTFTDLGTGTANLACTAVTIATTSLQFTATNTAGAVNQAFTLTVSSGGSNLGNGSGSGTFQFTYSANANCGPPNYLCSSTSTAVVGTLAPQFSTSTLFNSTAYGGLNPSYDCRTRLLDQNVVQYGTSTNLATNFSQGGLTATSGDNDVMSSLTTQYVALRANPAMNWIFAMNTSGPCIQNATNGGENPSFSVPGAFSFSRTTETVFYYIQSGHILNQATITPGTPLTYTLTSNANFPFDFDNCPAAGVGTGQSTSGLRVSLGDTEFGISISWTGAQGTSKTILVYKPGTGCSTIDLAPSGSSSTFANYYTWCNSSCGSAVPAGTENVCYDPNAATGSGIHEIEMTLDGNVVAATGACWVGTVTLGGSNDGFWTVNTGTMLGLGELTPYSTWDGNLKYGGHETTGVTHLCVTNAPTPNCRVESPLNTTNLAAYTQLATVGVAAGQLHSAWPHPAGDDSALYFMESAQATTYTTPAYLQNEVFAESSTGAAGITRFGSVYNSATSPNFSCGNGIGFVSQDGKWWFTLTDELLNLGLESGVNHLCSPVAIALQ